MSLIDLASDTTYKRLLQVWETLLLRVLQLLLFVTRLWHRIAGHRTMKTTSGAGPPIALVCNVLQFTKCSSQVELRIRVDKSQKRWKREEKNAKKNSKRRKLLNLKLIRWCLLIMNLKNLIKLLWERWYAPFKTSIMWTRFIVLEL